MTPKSLRISRGSKQGLRSDHVKFLMLLEEIDITVDAEHNKREFDLNSLQNNLLQSESVNKKSDLPFESLPKLEDWLISTPVFTRDDRRERRRQRED